MALAFPTSLSLEAQAVADAAHRLQEHGIAGVGLDLAAQAVDLHVDRAVGGIASGSDEILPRHARVLRPGTIDVAVLEPIRDIRVDHLDEQVEALRDRFAATLAEWPSDRGAS